MIIPCFMSSTRWCLTFGFIMNSVVFPYRAISVIIYGPRDRCYWIQCKPDNTRAELLVTFAINVKGTDAVCVSRCERVSWVWAVASRSCVSIACPIGDQVEVTRIYRKLNALVVSRIAHVRKIRCSYVFIQWKSDSRESFDVTWNYSHKSDCCDRSVIGACLYVIRTFNLLNTLAVPLGEVDPESLNHSIWWPVSTKHR